MKHRLPNSAYRPGAEPSDFNEYLSELEIESRVKLASTFEPSVSEYNPRRLKCQGCGEDEFLERPFCRCGAYLRGQLENEFFEWLPKRKEALQTLARNATRRSSICLCAAALPICLVLFGMTYNWLNPEIFGLVYPLAFFLGLGLLSYSVSQDRRSRVLKRAMGNLGLSDYLDSDAFANPVRKY